MLIYNLFTTTHQLFHGFDLSFEYETIIKELITLNDKSDFEVCRSESSTNFANGCAISYFDFCNWISQIDNTLEFESTQSLFDCFVTSHQIDLNDDYQHPSWLEDIFWFLDFALILASNRLNPLNKQQIEAVILQRRATY